MFAIAMTLLVVEVGVPETIEGAAEDRPGPPVRVIAVGMVALSAARDRG